MTQEYETAHIAKRIIMAEFTAWRHRTTIGAFHCPWQTADESQLIRDETGHQTLVGYVVEHIRQATARLFLIWVPQHL